MSNLEVKIKQLIFTNPEGLSAGIIMDVLYDYHEEEEIRKSLRILLERGDVYVGRGLRLQLREK